MTPDARGYVWRHRLNGGYNVYAKTWTTDNTQPRWEWNPDWWKAYIAGTPLSRKLFK